MKMTWNNGFPLYPGTLLNRPPAPIKVRFRIPESKHRLFKIGQTNLIIALLRNCLVVRDRNSIWIGKNRQIDKHSNLGKKQRKILQEPEYHWVLGGWTQFLDASRILSQSELVSAWASVCPTTDHAASMDVGDYRSQIYDLQGVTETSGKTRTII